MYIQHTYDCTHRQTDRNSRQTDRHATYEYYYLGTIDGNICTRETTKRKKFNSEKTNTIDLWNISSNYLQIVDMCCGGSLSCEDPKLINNKAASLEIFGVNNCC